MLDRRDAAVLFGIVAIGLALRLAWLSGYGLSDDLNFLYSIRTIFESGYPYGSYGYRFTWWVPTVALCRWLGGVTETGFIAPITAAAMVGITVVYLIGRELWGRPGGIIAALLLVVHPLDFAWSTMQANDIFASVFSAVAMFGVLRATHDGLSPEAQRWGWAIAAWGLFFAYHAKVSALAIVPALALIVWWRGQRLWPGAATFIVLAGILFGATALGAYALAGSPIAPYKIEMATAGLTSPDAVTQRRLTAESLWAYPRMLFWKDNLGGWTYGFQPALIVLAAIASRFVPFRWPKEIVAWFLTVFLVMEFQMTVRDGVLVTVFRNYRHSHAFVYPTVLILAGLFVSLREHRRLVADVALAAALVVGLAASIDVASKTHVCFADERAMARYIMTLPARPVHCDLHFATWFPMVDPKPDPNRRFWVLGSTEEVRRGQLDAFRSGYLVTGGGREPYYGCHTCIIRAAELPPGRYRLLREFSGPAVPTAWRPEAPRVWEGIPDPNYPTLAPGQAPK
jgi:4-amino-4-deoxy-L-arabinose transferase-like glycosyltransferase